ncbi:hypothetical protein [Mucilaginibacter glaciei]|uniref:hypothetical protein n=1 Tax=Mucilaginibacter glaciei TaxID=2772109 RepID=UPI001CD0C013|nr:hypothetical protein [Mucilaginibacter glaciei]
MDDKYHIRINNLLYSCVDKKLRSNESFVPEHALGYIISGETHLKAGSGVKIFSQGVIALVRRNQLIKSEKVPPANGGEFRSLNIYFTQEFLRR